MLWKVPNSRNCPTVALRLSVGHWACWTVGVVTIQFNTQFIESIPYIPLRGLVGSTRAGSAGTMVLWVLTQSIDPQSPCEAAGRLEDWLLGCSIALQLALGRHNRCY